MPGRSPIAAALLAAALLSVALLSVALGTACGAPEPLASQESLVASAREQSFHWSDRGPPPAFAGDRAACAAELGGDDFLRIQPPLNLALMMRGCLEKRGWRFETLLERAARERRAGGGGPE